MFFLLFVIFGCYIKKKKNWEMGEGCELWGGNEMGGGMYVCHGGEEKIKARGYMGGGEKNKKEKRNGE